MPPGSRDDYLEPYRQSARRHGCDFKVTLWASEFNQRRRFAVLAGLGRLKDKRVLDAGCSRGDFAGYLVERRVAYDHYQGIDGLPEVIAYARQRRLPRADFLCGDFLAQPDLLRTGDPQVIVMSGTLNTMTDPQVFALLEAAWAATSDALIFNFLSDRVGPRALPQRYPVRRFNTFAMLDWALRRTPRLAFRQDYFRHGHDATIMMRRND